MAAEIQEYDASTPGNNTLVGAISIAELMLPGNVNNAMRELLSQLRRAVANQGSDIASASATDIGAATGQYVKVTGTTTITALGTVNAGTTRWVEFTGALTLTHNGTSLKLPSSANITTANGDVACFVSLGSGNWKCLGYWPVSGKPAVPSTNGKHKLWVPAAAMTVYPGQATAFATFVVGTLPNNAWDFDASTAEYVFFTVSMPSSWDEGTITARFVWTAASGSGNVVWELYAGAFSDDDTLNDSLATPVTSTDTLLSANDLHRSPETSALTVENSPAANDYVVFYASRKAADAGDTLAVDARLLGVELYFTTDAAVDVA